jgi:hypothetical protein
MDSTDSTTTGYGLDDTNTTTLTYDIGYKGDCDYEPDYIEEEREMVRLGWHNPRKMLLPVKHVQKHINIQIRNQLPYKMCEVANVL